MNLTSDSGNLRLNLDNTSRFAAGHTKYKTLGAWKPNEKPGTYCTGMCPPYLEYFRIGQSGYTETVFPLHEPAELISLE